MHLAILFLVLILQVKGASVVVTRAMPKAI
jgi:hypothetical protein